MTIRPLAPDDSFADLTRLVHAAYKQLADMGFRYWGTWQSEEDTRQRCTEGHCLVAEEHGALVGTVTVKLAHDEGDPDWYRRNGVWVVTQFAVLPKMQGSGLGSALLTRAEQFVFDQEATEVAIDTAEGARHLIDFYSKRGYRHVGQVDWGGTNYVSVLMSKRIRPLLVTERLTLRDLTLDDVPTIQKHWADDRFKSYYPPGRLTPEHCREVLVPEVERLSRYPRTGHHWAVSLDGDVIGTARLTFESSQTGSIGYGLCADQWGKGFATEVLQEVCRFAFEECGLFRLQAFVFSPNEASKAVLRKCGFTFEGALRQKIAWGDSRVDDEIYGLLRHEWSI